MFDARVIAGAGDGRTEAALGLQTPSRGHGLRRLGAARVRRGAAPRRISGSSGRRRPRPRPPLAPTRASSPFLARPRTCSIASTSTPATSTSCPRSCGDRGDGVRGRRHRPVPMPRPTRPPRATRHFELGRRSRAAGRRLRHACPARRPAPLIRSPSSRREATGEVRAAVDRATRPARPASASSTSR